MSENISYWISCHLFYDHERLDFLIKKGIEPFISSLKERYLVNKFFFIRYRKYGPHIRLRIKLIDIDNYNRIKQDVEVYFEKFFNDYPSDRPTPKHVANGKVFWHPNNSIQFIDYFQEVERYGGSGGILIAEDHFEYSSELVIHMIKEKEPTSYEQIISASILINLAFCYGIGLDRNQSIQFFKLLYNLWMPLSFRIGGGLEVDPKLKKELSKNNVALFSYAFEKDKDKLISTINNWWNSFENYFESLPLDFQKWITDCSNINQKFRSTLLKEEIKIPKSFEIEVAEHFSSEEIEQFDFHIWYVYQSLVHMNNNRIGLRNRDEPYVNYLIHMAIKE
jgi:hypothetical protein